MRVRVVYALPQRQSIVDVQLSAGATVEEAVARSGLMADFPEVRSGPLNCAIFGRVVALTDAVRDGDRVEILRPLIADPKQSRRQAAARTPLRPIRK